MKIRNNITIFLTITAFAFCGCTDIQKGITSNASDQEVLDWAKSAVSKMLNDSLPKGYSLQIVAWEDISVFSEPDSSNSEVASSPDSIFVDGELFIQVGGDDSSLQPERKILYSRKAKDDEKEWRALQNGKRIDRRSLAPKVKYADPLYALSISTHHMIVGVIVSYREVSKAEGEENLCKYFFLDFDGTLLERGTMIDTY